MEPTPPTPKPGPNPGRFMILLTLMAYVALALGYNSMSRMNYAPDEPWHYFYVRSLADGNGLPTLETTHQAQHPPLYYAIGAFYTRVVRLGLGGEEEVAAIAEGREYTYPPLQEHALRFLSTLFGCGAILAVYAMARRLASRDPWLPIVAPAMVAFLPLFTYMTSVVNNDGLVILLVTLLLAQTAAYLQEGGERRLILSGIILGLAMLTKDSALAMLPLPVAAAIWRARRHGEIKSLVRRIGLVAGPAAALWIAWPIRNLVVSGSPFVRGTAKGSILGELLLNPHGVLWTFLSRTLTSFAAPEWIATQSIDMGLYLRGAILTIAVVAAGLLWRRKTVAEGEPWTRAFLNLSGLGLALLVAGILHYVLFVDYTAIVAGRYLLPMAGALALFAALALRALLPLRSERAAAIAAIAAWALMLGVGIWFLNVTRVFYQTT